MTGKPLTKINPELASYQKKLQTYQHRERLLWPIVEYLFAHQPAVYGDPVDYPTRIAQHFYQKCYSLHTVRSGPSSSPIAGAAHPTTPLPIPARQDLLDQFIAAICNIHLPLTRPKVFYLLGDVGIGKTAFLNWLISTRMRELVSDGTGSYPMHRMWFVRIETERFSHREKLAKMRPKKAQACLVREIAERIVEIIGQHPEIKGKSPSVGSRFEDLKQELLSKGQNAKKIGTATAILVREILTKENRRLLVIIDNLDYLAHIRSEAGPYETVNPNGDQLYELLAAIRVLFEHNHGPFSSLGASVLLVMRDETFDILTHLRSVESTSWSNSVTQTQSELFNLERPTLKEIVNARVELTKYVLSLEETKSSATLVRRLERLQTHLEKQAELPDSILENVDSLSSGSRRELVSFLDQYAWIAGDKEEALELDPSEDPDEVSVLDRLLHYENVGILAYFLQSYCRFSEQYCRFPSIYLVYSSRDALDTLPQYVSYWLRRLILEYIAVKQPVSPEEIMEIFCGPSDGYPEVLVRDTLSQLCEIKRAGLIRGTQNLDRTLSKIVLTNLRLTQRGDKLLQRYVDRFAYLQLVADEPWLWLPTVVVNQYFRNNGTNSSGQMINFHYLTAPSRNEYIVGLQPVIEYKIRAVYILLDILKASWDAEKERNATVFDSFTKLGEQAGGKSCLPNFSETETGIKKVHHRLRGHILSLQELAPPVSVLEESRRQVRKAILEGSHAHSHSLPGSIAVGK